MTNLAAEARSRAQAQWPSASIHSRGRNWIRHQHPTEPRQFIIDTFLGPIHIEGTETEIDTAWVPGVSPQDDPWLFKMLLADYHAYALPGNADFDSGQLVRYVHPASGEEIAFQPQQLQWTNDLDQIEPVADPQAVGAVILQGDDTISWIGAYGTGLDFFYQTQTARLQKQLEIASAVDLGSPPQFIIDGGNPVLRLQFIFQKSSGVEVWADGVLWDERSNNPITTSATVEFRGSLSEVLWILNPGWARDESDPDLAAREITATTRLRRTGPNLFVEILVPWTWLEAAVYPVVIDPTLTPQVSAGADDADEKDNDTGFDATGTVISVISRTQNNQRENAGFRFTGLGAITQGDTIDAATITVYCNDASRDDMRSDIFLERVTDAQNFTDNADVTSRSRTTASEAWDAVAQGIGDVTSPDFASTFQEWVDDFEPTSACCVLVDGRNVSGVQTMELDSYEASSTNAARLSVQYTAGARIPRHGFTNFQVPGIV